MSRTVFVLIGIILAASAGAAAAQPVELQGRVFDARTQEPLGGIRIEVLHTSALAVTDQDGRFRIEELPPGAHTLRASGRDYAVLVSPIEAELTTGVPLHLEMVPAVLRIHEAVVVSARRDETHVFDTPRSTSVVTSAELNERLPRTTPEALMESAGVWVQKTNHGGGSPFLRGLVGNHVLVLIDGIRLNNATFRLGPNQYLATIDPGQIERIEVIRGAGSVLHGSDALGGVINIVTRRPDFSHDGQSWRAVAMTKFVSAGMEQVGRLEVQGSAARVSILGGLSVRNYGDLKAGGRLGVESPSGYHEIDGDAKALFRVSPGALLTVAYQHAHQSDVPRFDQVAQRGFARYSFDPQVRRLGYAQLQASSRSRWWRTITLTTSVHDSSERRVRQRRGSSLLVTEEDNVRVVGLSAEIKSQPAGAWTVLSGLEYYRDTVGSWRRDQHLETRTTIDRRGLYPDDATASSIAAFVHSSLAVDRFTVELGGRYTGYQVAAADQLFGRLEIRPAAWVGSAGVVHALTPSVRIFGSLAQAFRAPNVDDLSTLGGFDFGVEVPAPELAPERGIGFEAGLKAKTSRFGGSVAVYRMSMRDLIDRVRSELDGSEFFEGQRVFRRANVGEAYIHGFETDVEWRLAAGIGVFANLTYTYGQQTTIGQPVRRIPPLNGLVGVQWRRADLSVESVCRFARRQNRLADGDRDDHRIAPGGTPGWKVIDLRARRAMAARVDLVGGISNLFNEAYRVHGSGIDGPGRSAWAAATVRF